MNWNEYLELSEKTLSTEFHCGYKVELSLHAIMGVLTEVEELLDNHMGEVSDEVNRGEEYIAILGRMYDLNIPNEVNTSIEDPMEIVLMIVKKSLKVLDFLKKKIFYNKNINDDLVILNVNEIISLLLAYSKIYEIDTPKSWDINIEKLRARYGEKFSSERAINRDLETEREILSK